MFKNGFVIQCSVLLYALTQSFLLPLMFGMEVYGSFVVYSTIIFVAAGVIEPFTQRDFIANKLSVSAKDYILSPARKPLMIVVLFVISIPLIRYHDLNSLIMFIGGVGFILFIINCSKCYAQENTRLAATLYVIQFVAYAFSLIALNIVEGFQSVSIILISFSVSQFIPLCYLFFKRPIFSNFSENKRDFSKIGVVLKDSLGWRGSLIYFNPLLFLLMSFNSFYSLEEIGQYKLFFSTFLLFRMLFPINMPIFMSVVERRNNEFFRIFVGQFLFYIASGCALYYLIPFVMGYAELFGFDVELEIRMSFFFVAFGVLFLLMPSVNAVLVIYKGQKKLIADFIAIILLSIFVVYSEIKIDVLLFSVALLYYVILLALFWSKNERDYPI